MRLNICKLPVEIVPDEKAKDIMNSIARYQPFIEEKAEGIEQEAHEPLVIQVVETENIVLPSLEFELKPYGFSVQQNQIIAWHLQNTEGVIQMESMWRKAYIYSQPNVLSLNVENYLQLGYTSYLTGHHGIFMHGAVIEYKGEGVILTATSGGGKSTLAGLCQQVFHSEIINGDKAIIRIEDGKATVFGSPWAGSSDIYINKGIPLKGIISIVKSSENSISKLLQGEAMLGIGQRIYYPYWDEALIEQSMETLEQILKSVPVFQLRCRPEEAAAELVKNVVYGEEAEWTIY